MFSVSRFCPYLADVTKDSAGLQVESRAEMGQVGFSLHRGSGWHRKVIKNLQELEVKSSFKKLFIKNKKRLLSSHQVRVMGGRIVKVSQRKVIVSNVTEMPLLNMNFK